MKKLATLMIKVEKGPAVIGQTIALQEEILKELKKNQITVNGNSANLLTVSIKEIKNISLKERLLGEEIPSNKSGIEADMTLRQNGKKIIKSFSINYENLSLPFDYGVTNQNFKIIAKQIVAWLKE